LSWTVYDGKKSCHRTEQSPMRVVHGFLAVRNVFFSIVLKYTDRIS